MKKISLFLILILVGVSYTFAQSFRKPVNFDHKNSELVKWNGEKSNPSYKTSEVETDTLWTNLEESYFNPGGGCSIVYYPSPINYQFEDGYILNGYINGTMNGIPFTDGSKGRQTEFGNLVNIPPRLNKKAYCTGAYIWFAPTTSIVGSADDFKLNFIPVNSSGEVLDNPTVSETFSGDNWIDWTPGETDLFDQNNHYIEFTSPQTDLYALKGNYVFSCEVATQTSDDTITFYISNPNDVCDPNDEYDWLIRLRNDADFTDLGWISGNLFWNGDSTQLYLDVLCMVPIIDYVGPDAIEEITTPGPNSGNLTVYGAYPSPAIVNTTLKYELASNDKVEIRVVDMSGKQVVYNTTEYGAKGINYHQIDVTDLACGTYMYVIKSSHGGLGGKFIVVK